jgi:curved DNA-binding protein CbpA
MSLGLEVGAQPDDIEAAYKALIVKNHPDQGGTDWLAAQLNEARDVLMRDFT